MRQQRKFFFLFLQQQQASGGGNKSTHASLPLAAENSVCCFVLEIQSLDGCNVSCSFIFQIILTLFVMCPLKTNAVMLRK